MTSENSLFAVLLVGDFVWIGGRLVAVLYDQPQDSKIVLPGGSKDALKKVSEIKY